jgi:hypothetical protein
MPGKIAAAPVILSRRPDIPDLPHLLPPVIFASSLHRAVVNRARAPSFAVDFSTIKAFQ